MLVNAPEITTTGSLGGLRVESRLDPDSLPHLQRVLTDMYSDKEMACIREPITNALDSHAASGQTRPIEVQSPSKLNSNFIVRDYGVGMSVDDIINIVSLYGKSTKRSSTVEAGQLGIGFKAPLTYANQFVIRGFKDGRGFQAVMTRNSTGTSHFEIPLEFDTDEPNGVQITIPVLPNDALSFANKVAGFMDYIPNGKALLNGVDVSRREWLHISDTVHYQPHGDQFGLVAVVMGGVNYPISDGELKSVLGDSFLRLRKVLNVGWTYGTRGQRIIFDVEMGSVDFTPSRESLEYSQRTKNKIVSLCEMFFEHGRKHLSEELASAKDFWDALSKTSRIAAIDAQPLLHPEPIEFNGIALKEITKQISRVPISDVFSQIHITSVNRRELPEFPDRSRVLLVTNFNNRKSTDRQYDILREYVENVLGKKATSEDFDGIFAIQSGSLKEEMEKCFPLHVTYSKMRSLVSKRPNRPKKLEEYWVYDSIEHNRSLTRAVPYAKDIYYRVNSTRKNLFYNTNTGESLHKVALGFNFQGVIVPENKVSAFRAQYPKAKHISELDAMAFDALYDKTMNLIQSQQSAAPVQFFSRINRSLVQLLVKNKDRINDQLFVSSAEEFISAGGRNAVESNQREVGRMLDYLSFIVSDSYQLGSDAERSKKLSSIKELWKKRRYGSNQTSESFDELYSLLSRFDTWSRFEEYADVDDSVSAIIFYINNRYNKKGQNA